MNEKHVKWMREAIKLAQKGAGFAAPNPMVGALIVRNGQIIGRGYHKRFGGPHAEVEAIRDCRRKGNNPAGATMLVSLEPCCHTGKTGPCTEAILEAGLSHVIIATLDDFEKVDGQGAARLRQAGVKVEVGICQAEARELNRGFFKLHRTGMPWITLKWAQSLDGKLSWPAQAQQRWLTGPKARDHVHQQRGRFGAIMVGSQTVLDDDPLLTVRLGSRRRHFCPLRVVLDGRLRIGLGCRLVTTTDEAGVLIYTSPDSLQRYRDKAAALREMGCQVEAIPQDSDRHELRDLRAILQDLGRRGVVDLMVEGGGCLHRSFLEQHLADEVMAYIAGQLIGGEGPQLIFNSLNIQMTDIALKVLGPDLLMTGKLRSENSGY